MTVSSFGFAFALGLVLSASTGVSVADTVEANCDVRKEGDTQKGRSGPCTFSQPQGYGVNRLGNGQFQIVWSKPFCSVSFDSGGPVKTTEDCTGQQIEQSKDAARRER